MPLLCAGLCRWFVLCLFCLQTAQQLQNGIPRFLLDLILAFLPDIRLQQLLLQTSGTTPHTGGALGNLNLIGRVLGRKLALSAPAPGYKELEVQVKEVCVCEAMKSPVGTLSNGTVLRQQDGGTKSRQVPIWQKSNLTLEEAAAYSGIGINKLRSMTDSDECKFVLWNGTKRLIKRRKLDEYLDKAFSI